MIKTVTMNLSQGLRHLKRIKEAVALVSQRIQKFNSVLQDGGVREINIRKALECREQLKTLMIDVKLALQDASRPIQRRILEISELKDTISFYQKIDCKHGKVLVKMSTFSDNHEERFVDAVVRESEVSKKCAACQRELDRLYTEIDAFNNSHFVELEEIPDLDIEIEEIEI